MLKFGVIITCDRCGDEDSHYEDYYRRGENEIMNKVRHNFFYNSFLHSNRTQYWKEMNDDIRHLCPKCSGEAAKLQVAYDVKFDKWIKGGTVIE